VAVRFRGPVPTPPPPLPSSTLAFLTATSFLLGAACSSAAGYVGMWVSVRANVRVAGAARRSSREALAVALRAGGVSSMLVVGMTVGGVTCLYATMTVLFGGGPARGGLAPADIPLLLVGYGFGASFVALFAQLGGGIYTKAADVRAGRGGRGRAGSARGRARGRGPPGPPPPPPARAAGGGLRARPRARAAHPPPPPVARSAPTSWARWSTASPRTTRATRP